MTEKVTGRPPFKPTAKLRRAVEEMRACGEAQETIARAIGCSDETLRKHFANELATGHAVRRREVIGLLFQSARGGNVSAQRKLDDMTRPGAARPEGERAPPLGKKEEAQEAALHPDAATDMGELMARRARMH
ncbi:MAG TPA: hypothetical protein VMS01_04320 [Stellaceae bacterium]|nr:hypothetical protein [Stellaceae bacterium]